MKRNCLILLITLLLTVGISFAESRDSAIIDFFERISIDVTRNYNNNSDEYLLLFSSELSTDFFSLVNHQNIILVCDIDYFQEGMFRCNQDKLDSFTSFNQPSNNIKSFLVESVGELYVIPYNSFLSVSDSVEVAEFFTLVKKQQQKNLSVLNYQTDPISHIYITDRLHILEMLVVSFFGILFVSISISNDLDLSGVGLSNMPTNNILKSILKRYQYMLRSNKSRINKVYSIFVHLLLLSSLTLLLDIYSYIFFVSLLIVSSIKIIFKPEPALKIHLLLVIFIIGSSFSIFDFYSSEIRNKPELVLNSLDTKIILPYYKFIGSNSSFVTQSVSASVPVYIDDYLIYYPGYKKVVNTNDDGSIDSNDRIFATEGLVSDYKLEGKDIIYNYNGMIEPYTLQFNDENEFDIGEIFEDMRKKGLLQERAIIWSPVPGYTYINYEN